MTAETHQRSAGRRSGELSATEVLPTDLTTQEVREQLERVLNSEIFLRAERLSRFLRYVVEQALAGEAANLKEYSIGLQVFDKPESFDTRVDPIVRVEAGRLRAKIRDYYGGEGCNDSVWLGLGKRGYRPVFRRLKLEVAAPAPSSPPSPATERPREPAPADARTIAVLPFEDLSPEKTQGYFCDGITQEIIGSLAKVDGLSVVAPTSVAQYKGRPDDIREIGRQLQVGRILEGSVQKVGGQVRISAHLVEAATGFDCWAETYDRPLDDILAIQDDVSQAITKALCAKTQGLAPSGSSKRPAAGSTGTYNLYLKALYHWEKKSDREVHTSIRYFQEVVQEDPNYAPAYAGLANGYIMLAFAELERPCEALNRARAAVRQAMAIDERLAECYVALGTIHALLERDWPAAEQAFHNAIKLNAHLAVAHHWFAIDCLMPLGRLDEALQTIQQALDCDPTSVTINTHLGLLFHMRREYDRAIRQFQLAVDLEPDFYRAHWGLGQSYVQKGMFEEAAACYERAQALSGRRFRMGGLGYCYARMGERDKALDVLSELKSAAAVSYVSPYNFAEVHAGFGDRNSALEWLSKADADHSRRVYWINVDPILDELRDEPLFRKIVASIKLTAAPAAEAARAL